MDCNVSHNVFISGLFSGSRERSFNSAPKPFNAVGHD